MIGESFAELSDVVSDLIELDQRLFLGQIEDDCALVHFQSFRHECALDSEG